MMNSGGKGDALIWESEEPPRESMVSITIGRALNTLLAARSRKLHDSLSLLSPNSLPSSSSFEGSLEGSLSFVCKYVMDASERSLHLDELLVPLIQHWLRNREMKHGGQAVVLLNWLFLDEFLFQYVAADLADIIRRKDDRHIALGWCILVRSLVECESFMDQYMLIGIRDNYDALLKILCSCIPRLSQIVCEGSTLQGGYELPSRLALSAADCMIALTIALTNRAKVPGSSKPKVLSAGATNRGVTAATGKKKEISTRQSTDVFDIDMDYLLWRQIDELVALLQKLRRWSEKSRPLHAKGVEQVLGWLQKLKGKYSQLSDEQAGANICRQKFLLLSSCWKYYGVLLHLEDRKFYKLCNELLDQYIAGIQHYTKNHEEEHTVKNDDAVNMRKFFLNCICLLLGRLDSKKFETVVSEYRTQMSPILLSQLQSSDEDVVAAAACIFKATLLQPIYSKADHNDSMQMEAISSLLLHLLDERDGSSKAVTLLIAEHCFMSTDGVCLKQVLNRISSGNVHRRRNAVDVISELTYMMQDSGNSVSFVAWQGAADKLIGCLSDEDKVIREQSSTLLAKMDPAFVLPATFHLVYSLDERVHSSASGTLIRMLKYHRHDFDVICMLINCLSSQSQNTDDTRDGSKSDTDPVYSLVSEWSKSVEDWASLIPPLLKKMFSEPTNATVVRFLSFISEYLADAADIVMYHVLLQMKRQKLWECRKAIEEATVDVQQHLFERLSPLLVLRMLPLRVFNNLKSSIIYGQLTNQGDPVSISGDDQDCVIGCLITRACNASEFEEVRKLAAELCGRIHPTVLFAIVSSLLESATGLHEMSKIKACLFAVCTSLVVRGGDTVSHPSINNIILKLEKILLLPSLDGDEVFKAQHGCIDCLALMICAELQALGSDTDSVEKFSMAKEGRNIGSNPENLVLDYVLHGLLDEKNQAADTFMANENCVVEMPAYHAFRLCMANVLISVCQKISDSGRTPFADKTVPCLIRSLEVVAYPDIRAACIQVLFSAVYHLKSAVAPYSLDLLKLSMVSLQKELEKERMAGGKLLASLMASEELILQRISGGLLEARSVLSSISSSDSSYELRQICKQLLSCIAFP